MAAAGPNETFWRRALTGLAVGVTVGALLGLLFLASAFENLEMKAFDGFHSLLASGEEADDDILLVTIDQGSIEKVKSTQGFSYPWPRLYFGKVLEFIDRGRPRGVLFDLLFEGPDEDREEIPGEESDAVFAQALGAARRVVLGYKVRPADPMPPSQDAGELLARASSPEPPWPGLAAYSRIDPLSPLLIRSGARLGFVNATPEGDGLIRRAPLVATVDGRTVLSLTAAAARASSTEFALTADGLQFEGRTLHMGEDGRAWIRFHGPGGVGPGSGLTYKYIPFYNVFQSAVTAEGGGEPALSADTFRDKWVIIGSTASAGFDLKATPFSREGTFPGMEIHATILDNLLHGDFFWRVPAWAVFLMLMAVCLLVGFLVRVVQSILVGGVVMLAGAGGILALSLLAFSAGVLFDLVALETGVFVTFASVTFFNFLRERRSKQYIRNIFQFYLDPSVVRRLIESPERLRLGGESRVCTALFSDIAGFTSIAEQLTPEQLVEMMNLYLGEMTEIVIRHGGFLDKYIGDALMAVFGAPADLQLHAEAACRAALKCHRRLLELEGEFQGRGLPAPVCRVGINTGPMVVGNMGSKSRMNYTAMGDAVNLASRLEGVNKEFGTVSLIGPDTHAALDDGFVTRELDLIRVKGKSEPVRIYELSCEASGVGAEVEHAFKSFAEGLSAYRARRWVQAIEAFQQVLAALPDDGPASTYIARCKSCMSEPPPESWNGVFVMTRK